MVLMFSSRPGAILASPLVLRPRSVSGSTTAAAATTTTTSPASLSSLLRKAPKLSSLSITTNQPRFRVWALQTTTLSPPTNSQSKSLLTGSTRTLSSIAALSFSVSRLLLDSIQDFNLSTNVSSALAAARALQANLTHSAGPLFFAAVRSSRTSLNTPLTVVVAAGLSKWLDIYSGVLMIRVLLSWFPNVPWDCQPFSAIRDLCDPYLNLFRNIIPPVFDTLDVSPLLAFAILGVLGSILKASKGLY